MWNRLTKSASAMRPVRPVATSLVQRSSAHALSIRRVNAPCVLAPQPFSLASMRRPFSSAPTNVEVGAQPSLEWRLYFQGLAGHRISPWHNIAMKNSDGTYNYVNEIGVGERAKMEVTLDELDNPIKQDVKKGKLRFFTYGDLPFNYGCIPQTWENPLEAHPDTGLNGDGDPVDVVEVSSTPLALGSVSSIKVLGIMALIDEEETDWKVLAIARGNPLYDRINNVDDLERERPGFVETVRDWFKNYKTTDGKPQNDYAFDGAVKDVAYTEQVLEECNSAYVDLCTGKIPNPDLCLPQSFPVTDVFAT